jgi:uncharacterized protein (UPF0332 family)
MKLDELLQKGFITKIKPDKNLVEKELKEAKYDLEKANVALEQKDFKWCIIKSYYSMFHAARGVLFSLGLKERRHFAVGAVLEELGSEGKLKSKFINDFKAGMSAREEADYRYLYSEDTARYLVDVAEEFLEEMKKIIKK